MAAAGPKKYTISDLKSKILQPALTSHYQVSFAVPDEAKDYILKQRNVDASAFNIEDYVTVPCSEASLPGSSFMTHELNDDYTGVSLRHAYRRQYDATSNFTFYVDAQRYYVIRLFEAWMSYISLEGVTVPRDQIIYSNRMAFPNQYQTDTLSILKFERDYQESLGGPMGAGSLSYGFKNAYPINISAMPLSYDSSQLLKCTVDFNFSRYVVDMMNPPPVKSPLPLGTSVPVTPINNNSKIVTNEYYNNHGDNKQNSTNFADFTDGSNTGLGAFNQSVG
jgi:hypothetical protein